MDNLCHTLAGLAIGASGLKRKTALAGATLIIGANLPDVDALLYAGGASGETALAFRRGWTHGLLAMALWPPLLAGLMLACDRLVRRRRRPDAEPADGRGLLLLAALSVWSHPLLDLLNTYGVRLLAPFSWRWFYGDALFIVDPWVWAGLLAVVILGRGAGRAAPHPFRAARVAFALTLAYILAMAGLGEAGRRIAHRESAELGATAWAAMAAPEPVTPLRRRVVLARAGSYATGRLEWLTGRDEAGRWWRPYRFTMDEGDAVVRGLDLPSVDAAARTRPGRDYLSWARFPFAVIGPSPGCPAAHVCLRDMRYYPQPWAEVAVPAAGPVSLAPSPNRRSQP